MQFQCFSIQVFSLSAGCPQKACGRVCSTPSLTSGVLGSSSTRSWPLLAFPTKGWRTPRSWSLWRGEAVSYCMLTVLMICEFRDRSIFTGELGPVHFKFSVRKKFMSYRLLHQSQPPIKYWPVPCIITIASYCLQSVLKICEFISLQWNFTYPDLTYLEYSFIQTNCWEPIITIFIEGE